MFSQQSKSELYINATIIIMKGIIETKKVMKVQNEKGVEKQFEIASQHSPQHSLQLYENIYFTTSTTTTTAIIASLTNIVHSQLS